MKPLPLGRAVFSSVEAVLTDVDGTLTTGGELRSSTLRAIEALRAARLKVALVTGRPAGWAEAFCRIFPVDAVIAENGGVTFTRTLSRVHKRYAEGPERRDNRRALVQKVGKVLSRFPKARLSSDSQYTEVDLAIDHGEDVKLPKAEVERLEVALRERGVTAVRSSVHINCWLGRFDKLSAAKTWLSRDLRTPLSLDDLRFVYAGDSFNDAPMFGAFPLSVGVANMLPLLPRMAEEGLSPPKFVTRSSEGQGFEELCRAILRARGARA